MSGKSKKKWYSFPSQKNMLVCGKVWSKFGEKKKCDHNKVTG